MKRLMPERLNRYRFLVLILVLGLLGGVARILFAGSPVGPRQMKAAADRGTAYDQLKLAQMFFRAPACR